MKRVFNWKVAILAAAVIAVEACGDDGIIDVPSNNEILEEDIEEINQYVLDKGYGDVVDTTESRVRYVILKEGAGEPIEFNDIVSVNYVGMFVDDSVFDTSIESVAIASDIHVESRIYEPLVFTHTASGWAMSSLGFIQGFNDGTTEVLKELNVGGSARIIIPSPLGYGSSAQVTGSGIVIPANTILVFDLYPVKVRK